MVSIRPSACKSTAFILSIVLAILLTGNSASAQSAPSAYEVVSRFLRQYNPGNHANLSFAKKPAGWFVRVLENEDITADGRIEFSKEYLFWRRASRAFEPLADFAPGPADNAQRARIWTEVNGSWFDLNRDVYYGYSGWDADVIKEFSGRENLNDTLRESLARAYGNYAQRFLWYQYGGVRDNNDPLQARRAPLDSVPAAAADSAAAYIKRAAGQYRIIAARHPGYSTLVGSAPVKWANEIMYGWNAMMLAGYPDKAGAFLKDVSLDSSQIRIARHLLDACPKNAILFTYGDNDTYWPWYLQESAGYRKDISVINVSLLGIPVYTQSLRKNGTVSFSLGKEVWGNPDFAYVYMRPGSDKFTTPSPAIKRTIPQFLNTLHAAPALDGKAPHYVFADTLSLSVNTNASFWKGSPYVLTKSMYAQVRPYYILTDLMMLDIISANLGKRPIFFTSDEQQLFAPHTADYGIVRELIPAIMEEEQRNREIEIKKTEALLAGDTLIQELRKEV